MQNHHSEFAGLEKYTTGDVLGSVSIRQEQRYASTHEPAQALGAPNPIPTPNQTSQAALPIVWSGSACVSFLGSLAGRWVNDRCRVSNCLVWLSVTDPAAAVLRKKLLGTEIEVDAVAGTRKAVPLEEKIRYGLGFWWCELTRLQGRAQPCPWNAHFANQRR